LITAAPLFGAGLSSLNIIAISEIGWRACYSGMAIFGFIVAGLAFIILEEPKRTQI
jgi:hypothetical protein